MTQKKHFHSQREGSGIARKDWAKAKHKLSRTNNACASPCLGSGGCGRIFSAPNVLSSHGLPHTCNMHYLSFGNVFCSFPLQATHGPGISNMRNCIFTSWGF